MEQIYLIFSTLMIPLIKAIYESGGEITDKVKQTTAIYGYLVFSGIMLHVIWFIAFANEWLK